MLFLHETHKVVGAREDDFEAAYRDGWMPTLAEGDDARLLWYTNHAHGSGLSYNVVTITGIADARLGSAWPTESNPGICSRGRASWTACVTT